MSKLDVNRVLHVTYHYKKIMYMQNVNKKIKIHMVKPTHS